MSCCHDQNQQGDGQHPVPSRRDGEQIRRCVFIHRHSTSFDAPSRSVLPARSGYLAVQPEGERHFLDPNGFPVRRKRVPAPVLAAAI